MLRVFIRTSYQLSLTLALLLALQITPRLASAQESSALEPSFGNGVLTIIGNAFKPGEKVTITVKVDGNTQQVTVTADSQGKFNLNTGISVKPGASLELNASGDQGTNVAVITAVPGALPQTGAPAPSFGWIIAAGLALLTFGTFVLRRFPRPTASKH